MDCYSINYTAGIEKLQIDNFSKTFLFKTYDKIIIFLIIDFLLLVADYYLEE